ncbi:hypothetical protein [Thermodesulforhabdus norvegica]|uniref:Uncharacterized protein n=1 Tax=Thermodesulforhabdus norvegica TaxID=39841 RepID=A0A1I4TBY1_9BACT|nr:hypothetical protein [Thermodesulforhabdus norvegica]SFM74141.1 hypothetical protein SAMN05660836_01332 [Thermodesulforhabdus norvegica]
MDKILEQKAALRRMMELRFCPPDRELEEAHLRKCLFCREWVDAGPVPMLFEQTEPLTRPSVVAPGQLWRTDESLAGYDEEDRYHNPILVLVVEKLDDDLVRVAPVHFEESLAFDGDVEIDRGLFAEMWNTFPFPTKYLARYEGTFQFNHSDTFREHRDIPTPVQRYFRKMEAEVAAIFVFKVWDEIMNGYRADVADLIANLDDKSFVEAKLPENASTLLDMLALAKPTDDYEISCQLAAADSTEEFRIVPVNVAYLTTFRVYVKTIPGRVTFWDEKGDRLVIGGQVSGEFSDDAGIHALWKHRDKGDVLLRADFAFFDPETGFFRVIFSGFSEDVKNHGDLALLICTR